MGNDYFCDTGSSGHYAIVFYSDDPLWDGASCGHAAPSTILHGISEVTEDVSHCGGTIKTSGFVMPTLILLYYIKTDADISSQKSSFFFH